MEDLQPLITALLLIKVYKHMKFQDPTMKAFGDMLRTSLIFPFLQKQRAITQKLQMEKCRPLITALLHINVYKHMKFQDPRSKAFGDMLRTSLISPFLQTRRAITPKLRMEKL